MPANTGSFKTPDGYKIQEAREQADRALALAESLERDGVSKTALVEVLVNLGLPIPVGLREPADGLDAGERILIAQANAGHAELMQREAARAEAEAARAEALKPRRNPEWDTEARRHGRHGRSVESLMAEHKFNLEESRQELIVAEKQRVAAEQVAEAAEQKAREEARIAAESRALRNASLSDAPRVVLPAVPVVADPASLPDTERERLTLYWSSIAMETGDLGRVPTAFVEPVKAWLAARRIAR